MLTDTCGMKLIIVNSNLYSLKQGFIKPLFSYNNKATYLHQLHTGQCLRRIAGGNIGLPFDTT